MNNCNCRVKCNVCECVHNSNCNTCNLDTIEISHEKTFNGSMTVPHFCKSFDKR